ncbi:MAG: phospholipase D-like domain-containing protein [Sandaracinaceae bacterium]
MTDFADPTRPIAMSFLSGRGHYDTVVKKVQEARVSVWIATANLKGLLVEEARVGRRRGKWRPVMDRFRELADQGVELRILHAGHPSRAFRADFDSHPVLVKGGLVLKQCPRLHFKTVIVDGRGLYLGSANWTGAGLGGKSASRRNFELGFWSEDEGLLDRVQGLYEHLWQGGECGGCGRRDTCGAPLDL